MAENYGIRAGLGPDYESKYHMRAQSAPENIGVNSEAMDFQMPYRATFLNGLPESKEDYVSALAHGMNSNDDDASNARYQELLQKREDLKKQIAQLSADIAYQERLRALEMKNDPMWDIAKQQYIMKGDSSGLESIMSRMEAEKGRKLTEETALANKSAEDLQKIESYKKALRKNLSLANFAYSELKRKEDPESRRAAFNAYIDVLNSAEDLKMPEEDLKKLIEPEMYERLEALRSGVSVKTPEGDSSPKNLSDLKEQVENGLKNAKSTADYDTVISLIQNNADILGGTSASEYTTQYNKATEAKKAWIKGEPARKKKRELDAEIKRINNLKAQLRRDAEDDWNTSHPDNKIPKGKINYGKSI